MLWWLPRLILASVATVVLSICENREDPPCHSKYTAAFHDIPARPTRILDGTKIHESNLYPWMAVLSFFYGKDEKWKKCRWNEEHKKPSEKWEECKWDNINRDLFSHFCGGSLINRKFVITAKHCCQVISSIVCTNYRKKDSERDCKRICAADVLAIIGNPDLGKITFEDGKRFVKQGKQPSDETKGRFSFIRERLMMYPEHENYRKMYNDDNFAPVAAEDICMIELSHPLTFTDSIRPIYLARNDNAYDDENLIVAGWGYFEIYEGGLRDHRQTSPILRAGYVTLCRNVPDEYKDRLLCLMRRKGKGGVNECKGDSGGPVFAQALDDQGRKSGLAVQLGLTSMGNPCEVRKKVQDKDPGLPSTTMPMIHVKTSHCQVYNWIAKHSREGDCSVEPDPDDIQVTVNGARKKEIQIRHWTISTFVAFIME